MNKTSLSSKLQSAAMFCAVSIPLPLHASLNDFAASSNLTDLENSAAIANQAVYEELLELGCSDTAERGSGACDGGTFQVWQNVRELVHTANDILGNSGPTFFSLGVDEDGLGFSLRWTAMEEMAAQQSLSNGFASAQLSALTSRISAMRRNTLGFGFEVLTPEQQIALDALSGHSGLNAGDQSATWSRWSAFLNGNYTQATQDPTGREDAYEMDGQGLSAGLDYRLDDKWVIGSTFGYNTEDIEFDGTVSIVDADIEMEAWSIMPYVVYQSGTWHGSASLGYQQSDFKTRRAITYPSLNPNTSSVDTTALSSNDATNFSLNVTTGYTFNLDQTTLLEPTITLDYRSLTIDAFSEQDILNNGFGFDFEKQQIDSFEMILAVVARRIFSTSAGVFIPYFGLESHWLDEDQGQIDARYNDLENQSSSSFSIQADKADSRYLVYRLGVSSVIYGASQSEFGGAASGGLQAFFDYRYFDHIDDYEQVVISAGIRYEL